VREEIGEEVSSIDGNLHHAAGVLTGEHEQQGERWPLSDRS
jgi:hypothetical protein